VGAPALGPCFIVPIHDDVVKEAHTGSAPLVATLERRISTDDRFLSRPPADSRSTSYFQRYEYRKITATVQPLGVADRGSKAHPAVRMALEEIT
jgi:hypothetical protein